MAEEVSVANNSNEYVIVRTEASGFILIPPKTVYNGRNVANYDYILNNVEIIDKGKIDGVVLSSGKIFKVSDSEESPFNVRVKVEQETGQVPVANYYSITDKMKSLAGDAVKGSNDKSGNRTLFDGSVAGDWLKFEGFFLTNWLNDHANFFNKYAMDNYNEQKLLATSINYIKAEFKNLGNIAATYNQLKKPCTFLGKKNLRNELWGVILPKFTDAEWKSIFGAL